MILFTRTQYINYLKEKRRILYIEHTPKEHPNHVIEPRESVSIHEYANPEKPTYDRKFIKIMLSGMKFAGISHDNHDITKKHIEALINFMQVCSFTDFYIVFKLLPYMPMIIVMLQIFQFIAIISKFTRF